MSSSGVVLFVLFEDETWPRTETEKETLIFFSFGGLLRNTMVINEKLHAGFLVMTHDTLFLN